jgi:hypothetical protein
MLIASLLDQHAEMETARAVKIVAAALRTADALQDNFAVIPLADILDALMTMRAMIICHAR